MKFEAITIKDIAKALNLSVSTVSKALRGSHEISEETKQQVLAYARENNYKPNPIAQSLKRGRSKSIGVIVSMISIWCTNTRIIVTIRFNRCTTVCNSGELSLSAGLPIIVTMELASW